MKAFICVYRHYIPPNEMWRKTKEAAQTDSQLQKILEQYKNSNCFFDWGDDPSFFAAQEKLGNVRAASWGVCRRDVRMQLLEGDFVVFFCAKQDHTNDKVWDYYLIGCATVKYSISRQKLWNDARFSEYRNFYNVLAKLVDGELVQQETFHNYHSDWRKRVEAGYIIFDSSQTLTKINVSNPLHVARKNSAAVVEEWFSNKNQLVSEVEKVLFEELNIRRRLRTTSIQHPHRHIAICGEEEQLRRLRLRLFQYI